MVNAFVFSLDIPVMIKILYEMIKMLHVKMSNAVYLYWFHNDILTENNSLNGHFNEPWINWYSGSSCLRRSSLFIVVPTLISWSKTKISTDYNDKI